MNDNTVPPLQLFYSYSHEDAKYRKDMKKALSLLKSRGFIADWSDQKILAGQNISQEIQSKMDDADIIVFLFSNDFIASTACMEEWEYAQTLASQGKMLFRIPIILRECAWLDALNEDDVKALPRDGNPISSYEDEDAAWLDVYEGIKGVVEHIRQTLNPREEYLKVMESTEFLSQHSIRLQDIYVFLNLVADDPNSDKQIYRTTIRDQQDLLRIKRAIIHGPVKSGKSALARHLYLSLVAESAPVLLLDLDGVGGEPREIRLTEAFHEQFYGDYSTWIRHDQKTLIVDNMTAIPRHIQLLELAEQYFERIIVLVASDVFHSFFRDEIRLAKYRDMHIAPLTHIQQEKLIRTRAGLLTSGQPVQDGLVDRMEDRVNSIVISGNILPRYPFYILSILQTYEGFMPGNLNITSYGHCYHVLIVASLIRSGVSNKDDEINACFNFASRLAYALYMHEAMLPTKPFDFELFVAGYKQDFHIRTATLNRLWRGEFPILDELGQFKSKYMYYYFLGKYLADNEDDGREVLAKACDAVYVNANYLTILFTIHHSNAVQIIDDILDRTISTLGSFESATLEVEETKAFRDILTSIPDNILSNGSVEEARREQRALRGEVERLEVEAEEAGQELDDEHPINDVYRILKNNAIMGQILRNKYGILRKEKVQVIVETIANAGLRLVSMVLGDEDEVTEYALYLHEKEPSWDLDKIKEMLQFLALVWTMINIREVEGAIGVQEIRESVELIVQRNGTPAYDILGYFNLLSNAVVLTAVERDALKHLFDKHEDPFVRWILSMRTQQYMNTHHGKAIIEQAVCSILDIGYARRIR